jgi:hypothetical protein
MHGLSDTDPKVARMQIELLRQKSPGERLQLMCAMSEMVIQLSRQNLERQLGNPHQARIEWIKANYGAVLAEGFRQANQP